MKARRLENKEKKIIVSRNPIEAYAQGKEAGRKEWEDKMAGECTLQGMIYVKDILRQLVFNVNDRSNETNSNGNMQSDFMTRPQLKVFTDRLLETVEDAIKDVIRNDDEGITITDKVDILYAHDDTVKKLLNEAYEKQEKRNAKKGVVA